MALYTRCILRKSGKEESWRVSVLSSHMQSDGETPDPRITKESFNFHGDVLAPSYELLGDFHRKVLTWDEFKGRYLEQLRGNHTSRTMILELAKMARRSNVTLLGIKESPEFCHRRILAEECERLAPGIVVEIN